MSVKSISCAFLLVLVVACFQSAHATGTAWQWENPRPTGSILYGAVEGANQIVAVGSHGSILTSVDAYSWVDRPIGSRNDLSGIAWNGTNQYVAVGFGGLIVTSPDGINWVSRASGTTEKLSSVIWNASLNQYVAVGGSTFGVGAIVLTSPDGITWTNNSPVGVPTSNTYLNDVVWGNSQYVAVGKTGWNSALILTSPDGVTWTQQTTTALDEMLTVEWSPTLAEFLTSGITGTLLASPNGTTWTQRTFPVPSFGTWSKLKWNSALSHYVAVGFYGDIQVSADGINWIEKGVTSSYSQRDVVWSQALSMYVSVGGQIKVSANGNAWTTNTSGRSFDLLRAAASNGNQYVAVGLGTHPVSNWTYPAVWTRQGNVWTSQLILDPGSSPNFIDVVWSAAKGIYVAVGVPGIIYTSPDGVTWTSRTSAGGVFLNSVNWNPNLNQFVVVGSNALSGAFIQTSPDGITWTQQNATGIWPLQGVTWGGGQYIAVGDLGTVVTSPDGVNWTAQTSGTSNLLNDVVWSPTLNLYVAVGNTGTILTSPDGITWNVLPPSYGNDSIMGIEWNGTEFTAVLNTYGLDKIIQSPDGVTWQLYSNPVTAAGASAIFYSSFFGIHWNQILGEYLVVGENAAMIRSVPDITPPMVNMFSSAVSFEATGPLTDVTALMAKVSVSDDTDRSLVVAASPAGPYSVGAHVVTWSATDSYGNVGTAVQNITITDTTPPIISVNGSWASITQGSNYVDAGATATDLVDGDLTASIVVNSNVNTAVVGTYTVTYNVSDAAANPALTKTRTVIVMPAMPGPSPSPIPGPGAIPVSGGGGGGGCVAIGPDAQGDPVIVLMLLLSAGVLVRRKFSSK